MAEWTFKRDTAFRKQFFVPDSFAHPAKMDSQLLIKIVTDYTEPGDVILDPMAGSGTLMLACMMGRHCILVELEEKFCKMCRDNWEIVRMHPQLGYEMGKCQIIRGDARNLEGLLADKIITSPPYADIERRDRSKESWWDEEREVKFSGGSAKIAKGYQADKIITSPPYAEQVSSAKDGIDWGKGKEGSKKRNRSEDASFNKHYGKGFQYTDNPNNIGNLPYGQISKIITSPPYAEGLRQGQAGFEGLRQFGGAPQTEEEIKAHRERQFSEAPYSENPDNLGNLSYGNIDSIITSPPYEHQVHGGTTLKIQSGSPSEIGQLMPDGYSQNQENIGNLKSTTYLEAMFQVYHSCFAVLRDGGLLILVVKNFIRQKKVIRLDTDTIKLCEQAGFSYLHRHYRKLPSQSFWRILYHKKHPEVEQILYEDVLVFKK